MLSLCAGLCVAGAATMDTPVEAAYAQDTYATVDVAAMAKITDVYVPNGNINMMITLSETDMASGNVTMDAATLKQKLQAINFFDNICFGEKTLTELGFSGDFWDNSNRINFGAGEPQKVIYMSLHADPATFEAAYNNGDFTFGQGGSTVTFKKGALIPGYNYLMGNDNATVYRASMDFETHVVDHTQYTYGLTTYGLTDVDSLRYVQAYDAGYGYFGFSLAGDDYDLGDGATNVELATYINVNLFPNYFTNKLLINGESGKFNTYSLFNLGAAGRGYLSIQMTVPEEEIETITIPAGTLFPSVALKELTALNKNGVWIYYQTQTTKTYYRTESGYFCLDDVKAEKVEALDAAMAEKSGDNYFAEDVTAVQNAVATAKAAIEAATDVAGVDAAYAAAEAIIAPIGTKAATKAAAIAELNAYKAEEGYFRAAEVAERASIIAGAETTINGATEKATIINAVATAKTGIDALKTAAQYADEELKPLKDAARAAIEGYKADVVYLAEEAAVKAEAVATGLNAVKDAATESEIAAAEATAKAAIDAIVTKAAIVEAATAELNAYKAEEGYFLAAETAQRADIIATAVAAFGAAENAADMEAAEATAKAAIDALKTAEEYFEENEAYLAPFKAEAKEAINTKKATVNYDMYSDDNAAIINVLYKDAKDAIAAATTEAELDTIVANFAMAIDSVPQTTAQDGGSAGNGCGSVASFGAAICLAAAGVVMALRKKED